MTSLRDQLQGIYDRRGHLTPELVVEEARPEDSPLHHELEWDNEVCGDAYRLIQAHRLIQRVRVSFQSPRDGAPRNVRAFQAVRGESGYRYEPSEKVAGDPFLSRLVMADMQREWHALKRRYEDFAEFWDLVRGDAESQAA